VICQNRCCAVRRHHFFVKVRFAVNLFFAEVVSTLALVRSNAIVLLLIDCDLENFHLDAKLHRDF
jgi:hypothetical protein